MPKTQLSPNDLSDMLDATLPPNSNQVYAVDNAPRMIHVAQLLTDDTDYQLSSVGQDIIHDKVLTELNTQHMNGRYTQIIPFGGRTLSAVAGIVIAILFSFGVLASEPDQPLYAVKQVLGIGSDDDQNALVTTITVAPTETLALTSTPSPTVTNTPEPTVEFTETSIPTDMPTTAPASAVVPIEAVVQYVRAESGVYVRSLPDINSDIITTVDLATAIVVTGYNLDGTWAQVFLEDGTTGWISTSLLSDTQPTVNTQTTTTTNENDNNGGGNDNPPNNGNGNNAGNNNPPNNGGNGNNNDGNNRPPRGGNGRGGRGGNNGNGN